MNLFKNAFSIFLFILISSAYADFKDKNVSEHLDKITDEGIVREVYFIDSFIAHNSRSADMAAIAAKKAKSPEIRILAEKMHKELIEDNQKMAERRKRYNASIHQAQEELPGPVDITSLSEKEGTEFDLQFIKLMSKQLKKGVRIAQELNPILGDDMLKKLAENSASRQTVQIGYLQQISDNMGYKL